MKDLNCKIYSYILILLLLPIKIYAQNTTETQSLNILFYNVENLFDTKDDPLTEDEEFLPNGERHWTKKRFENKINQISKVIMASCEFDLPDIVGLCEIENRYVVEALTDQTPLAKYNYKIIHKDSPDERGIDVALIYRNDKLTPIRYDYIPLVYQNGKTDKTREILHAQFLTQTNDTLHVFFNHWPSRYGGQAGSEPLRILAAQTLKKETDKISQKDKHAKIVIMGDFNDQPQNKSLSEALKANIKDTIEIDGELINLSANWTPEGTIKYQQNWQIFDQIIVSDYLLSNSSKLSTTSENAQIVNLPFLLINDTKYKGNKLNRTYLGYKYQGGFSDHLPIRLTLFLNQD